VTHSPNFVTCALLDCEHLGVRANEHRVTRPLDGERRETQWFNSYRVGETINEIGAIQRAVVSEDRRLVSITRSVADRCERLARDPTGARYDLRPDQVLDECVEYATLHYQEALGLHQSVEMPDPTMNAQAAVDAMYEAELPITFCTACEHAVPADDDEDREGWTCWQCGTHYNDPRHPPTREELKRVRREGEGAGEGEK